MSHARARNGLAVALGYGVAAAQAQSGCEISGWAYAMGLITPGNFTSSVSCKEACKAEVNCSVYGYYPGSQECFLGADAASPLVKQVVEVVAGPVSCTEEASACSGAEAPSSWPAATEALSMSAWPVGFQPQANQCYNPATCTAPPVTLQDVASGWEINCVGMPDKTAELAPGVTCEEHCLQDESCAAFQVGLNNTCWQGRCTDWDSTSKPSAGKRFQRGSVRTLRSLVGVQVIGLTQIFGLDQVSTVADPADECFKICASILPCQYWQLSNVSGCWIEFTEGQVIYPLVQGLGGYHTDSIFAPDMVAGGYLQRFCPEEEVVADDEDEFPAGAVIAFIATVMMCILTSIGVMYLLGCFKRRGTKGEGRGVKVAHQGQQQPLVQPGQTSLFDQIDTNHDGMITKDEFMRSVQVGSLVAPGVQPLPTVAAPMPAYQMVQPPQPGYPGIAQPAYGMPPGPPMPYPPLQQ